MLAKVTTAGLPTDDATRIDVLRELERLKCAVEGAQAAIAVDFDGSQRQMAAGRGVRPEKQGDGIGHQVALARRESPQRGGRHLAWPGSCRELPHTWAAWQAGHIDEWQRDVLARETACLPREHRAAVDEALAADAEPWASWAPVSSSRRGPWPCRRSRLRASRGVGRRRPSAGSPCDRARQHDLADGVASGEGRRRRLGALTRTADRLGRDGDPRSQGQIMADALVARSSPESQTTGGACRPSPCVMTDAALIPGADDEAASTASVRSRPTSPARSSATRPPAVEELTLRRLFAAPETGELVAMELERAPSTATSPTSSSFATAVAARPGATLRSGTATTSRLAAHRHHLGRTGQGLCEACNYAKEAVGWQAWPRPGPVHTVETMTPTGHRYVSTAPLIVPLRRTAGDGGLSPMEHRLAELLQAA